MQFFCVLIFSFLIWVKYTYSKNLGQSHSAFLRNFSFPKTVTFPLTQKKTVTNWVSVTILGVTIIGCRYSILNLRNRGLIISIAKLAVNQEWVTSKFSHNELVRKTDHFLK